MSFPDVTEARQITSHARTMCISSRKQIDHLNDQLTGLEKCKAGVLYSMHKGHTNFICWPLKDADVKYFETKGFKIQHVNYDNTFESARLCFPIQGTKISWSSDE